MKRILAFALLLNLACASKKDAVKPGGEAAGVLGPAAQKWAAVEQPKEFVDFFDGSFDKLALTVEETGETFTVIDAGDRYAFENGKAADVDFVVPVRMENIERMLKRAEDDKLDDEDAYAIVKLMFTPMTRAFFTGNPIENEQLREISQVEDTIKVVLLDPQGGEGAAHTTQFREGRWQVLEQGGDAPKRTFRITARQAMEYQKRAHAARKQNNPAGWIAFLDWYKQWRETVSTTGA